MFLAILLKRFVIATGSLVSTFAFLLGIFPSSAGAAPVALGCQVNQTDGISLKSGQSIIENTTDKVIQQGTVIKMMTRIGPAIGKVKFVTDKVVAPSTLQKHDRMSGGDTVPNALSCNAEILLVQPKTGITNRLPVFGK